MKNRKFSARNFAIARQVEFRKAYRSELKKILPVDGQCFYLSVTSAYARETYKSVGLIGFLRGVYCGNKNAFEEGNASTGRNRSIVIRGERITRKNRRYGLKPKRQVKVSDFSAAPLISSTSS